MADTPPQPQRPIRDWVALVLAVGFIFAVIIVTVGTTVVAINGRPLSENATQLLTGTFGGLIGVMGAFLGFKAGERHERQKLRREEDEEDSGQ